MEENNIDDVSESGSEKGLNFELLQAEKVEPLWWDEKQIEIYYDLHRLNSPAGRIYFRFAAPNEQEPIFYGGATSIGKEMPQEENLIQWIANTGYSQAKRYYYLRSLFGSFEHSRIAELAIMGKIVLDEIPERIRQYFFENNFYLTEKERRDMSLECQKDLISVQQWIIDHEVQFMAIELPVFSDHDEIATQIDAVAKVTDKNKETKENEKFIALINYKSSKSGVREEHRFQLETERNLFLERFPEFQKENVKSYNLTSVSWRKTNWQRQPGQKGKVAKPYSFSPQTPKLSLDRYNAYMELAKVTRNKKIQRPITTISGEMNLGDDVMRFIKTRTIKEIVESGEWHSYTKTGKIVPEIL